jgi:hypothetical protein
LLVEVKGRIVGQNCRAELQGRIAGQNFWPDLPD